MNINIAAQIAGFTDTDAPCDHDITVDEHALACEKSELFCNIAGTTTLTDATINAIKALGYVVAVVQDVKTL